MATDYDAPRVAQEDQPVNESLEAIKAHEELQIQVVPQQDDEFTCMNCFLVRHRSQLARQHNGAMYCSECES